MINQKTSVADYIQKTDTILAANLPFVWSPNHPAKIGVLLIHGLLDTPFVMHDIGQSLATQGFLVKSVLLPGHGTSPSALLDIDYHAWLDTVKEGIHSLAGVEKIILIGLSTGASLALYHASKASSRITGAVLIAPALKIRSCLAPHSNAYRRLSFLGDRVKWLTIATENDYAKYQSIPFNAVYQVYQLGEAIKKMNQPRCPLFMIATDNDETINNAAAMDYFKKNTNPKSELLLYSNRAVPIQDARMMIRPSAYPSLGIKNFSHVALAVAPTNAHYGEHGDYIDASHINKDLFIYGAKNLVKQSLFDLLFKLHLTKKHYRRLTFNPDFDFMMGEIYRFISSLS